MATKYFETTHEVGGEGERLLREWEERLQREREGEGGAGGEVGGEDDDDIP